MHSGWKSSPIKRLAVFMAVLCVSTAGSVAHDRGLLRTLTPVVDMMLHSSGDVLMYTQDFVVYRASKKTDTWTVVTPTFKTDTSTFEVLRVGRVFKINNIVLIGGNIVSNASGSSKSAILRSEDEGASFSIVQVSNDTLGTTDDMRLTQDGLLFYLDRVGRLWSSMDVGASWTQTTLPKPIPLGGARELDMISKTMGVCVDIGRSIHFTTNGWGSVISPMASKKPIRRTQPSFLDYFAWSRTLTFWQNELILEEGADIFRSASNDLHWSLWKGVHTYTLANDRSSLVYWSRDGQLQQIASFEGTPTVVATDVLQPDLIRLEGDKILTFRPDTGPVVYSTTGSYAVRPYTALRSVRTPSIEAAGTKKIPSTLGVASVVPGAIVIDILSKNGANNWSRDTVLDIGPVHTARMISDDEMVFGKLGSKYVYNRKSGTVREYIIRNPIEDFLKKPIARFKMRVAADELDSTHVKWTEFRNISGTFRCAELVDSSQYGVSSDLIDLSISATELRGLLENINRRGSEGIDLTEIDLGADVQRRFSQALDTIFAYDAYFDVFDIYRPPPAPEVQAADCRTEFKRVLDTIETLAPATIKAALLYWRRVPKDEFSRYEIELQNTAGKVLVFKVEREDEAHPPLMAPWVGNYQGWQWHVYEPKLTKLFASCVPQKALPQLFQTMAREEWLLVAVASYLDGMKYGRWHRWANREVTPAARN